MGSPSHIRQPLHAWIPLAVAGPPPAPAQALRPAAALALDRSLRAGAVGELRLSGLRRAARESLRATRRSDQGETGSDRGNADHGARRLDREGRWHGPGQARGKTAERGKPGDPMGTGRAPAALLGGAGTRPETAQTVPGNRKPRR